MSEENEVVKIEVLKLPKIYIIGKEIRYNNAALESGDNRLPEFWDNCIKENIFAPLEAQTEYIFENSYVGVFLDWHLDDGDFSHIVGMLMREGVAIPEGYFSRELAETEVAWCWVKCKNLNETRAVPFETTEKAITGIGRSFIGMKWCVDVYHRSRSTIPDENGCVILDCYIPLD